MLKTTDETIDITQQTPHMSLACGEFKFKIHKPCCNGQWSRTAGNIFGKEVWMP